MTQIERIIARGQRYALQFMQDDVAASQTDVQIGIVQEDDGASNQSIAGVIMPLSGEIIGISWKLSAAASAGSLTIGPTIDGTEKTALTQTVTTAASGYAVVPRGTILFPAGSEIGVEITSGDTWDGTSSDLAVWVHVIDYLDGI